MSDTTSSSSSSSSSSRPGLSRSFSASSSSYSSVDSSAYGEERLDAMLPKNNSKRTIRPKPTLQPSEPDDVRPFEAIPPFPKHLVFFAIIVSILAVGIGFLLSYAGTNVRIEGVRAWRWGIVIAVIVVSYFIAVAVTMVVLGVIGGISRVAWHFLRPMVWWISALVWIAIIWAVYRLLLGSDLAERTSDAIEKVLIALVAVCLIFCARAFVCSLFEMHVYRNLQQPVREGRVLDFFMHLLWAGKSPTSEQTDLIKKLTKISHMPFVGLMQVVGVAYTMENGMLQSLAPNIPKQASVDDAVKEETSNLTDSLFACLGNPSAITGKNLMMFLGDRNNAIGGMSERKSKFVYEVLDVEMSDMITREIATEAFEDIIARRLTLIGDIRGHQLLVRILHDLLGIVVYAVSAFLILGSIGVDLLALLVPASAMFFAFAFAFSGPIAEFVRGFIFVFFRRPYELEDWVTVEDGPELIVKSVSVLVTEFQTLGGYAVSYANATLAGKKLGNMRRSTSVCNAQFYTVKAGSVAQSDIAYIKAQLTDLAESNPKAFYPAITVLVSEATTDAKMKVKVVYTVKCRWNQKGIYSEAGSLVHLRIVDIFKSRDIEWGSDYKIQRVE